MLMLTIASSTILFIFSFLVYFSIVRFSHERFYELLKIRIETLILSNNQFPTNFENIVNEIIGKSELPEEKDYILQIQNKKQLENIEKIIDAPNHFFNEVYKKEYATFNNDTYSFVAKRFLFDNKEYIAVVKAENVYVVYYLNYLEKTLLICLLLALFFSAIFSFYLSKTLYKPIGVITKKVKQISTENLHLRLANENYNKELSDLIDTFNDMLNRLETSFETQNYLIGNVSHELRTPLTSIMGEAEVSLALERDKESYKQTLGIVLNEAEKLDKKLNALLLIAQTGFNGKIQKMDLTRTDQLLWDVIETLKRLNNKNNIVVDLSMIPDNPKKLKVKGNEQLLHLALSNIISNACKYSNYQQVKVALGATNTHVYIIVKDDGIGIPEKDMNKIYDPFFRASNTQNYEGYGIGLPLAKNIIQMHNGEVIVNSVVKKGTTVEIKIPTIQEF